MLDMIQTPEVADLKSRALLVTLSIKKWNVTKQDNEITLDVNSDLDVEGDAGRYRKTIVPKASLKKLHQIVSAWRAFHDSLTSPWLDKGTRILPVANFDRWSRGMREFREDFEREVAVVIANLDDIKADASRILGQAYDPDDYPTADEIAEKYGSSTKVVPMPSTSDFRVDLSADVAEAIKADVIAQMNAVIDDAMADTWQRLHKVVTHMATKLAEFEPAEVERFKDTDGKWRQKTTKATVGTFRDSLVENVRDLVEVLPALNLTGDARLTKMIEDTREKLIIHDAETLRSDDAAREDTAKAAAEIADAMGAFMAA